MESNAGSLESDAGSLESNAGSLESQLEENFDSRSGRECKLGVGTGMQISFSASDSVFDAQRARFLLLLTTADAKIF